MDKKQLCKMIDHTLLKPATKRQIRLLCDQAKEFGFASVCVQPDYVKLASKQLAGSNVQVCTVVGFPLGENSTQVKVYETKQAIKNGATEIDMVINQSWAKGNEWRKIEREIASIVKACKGLTVKCILETCNLNQTGIVKACKACINAGANFVKTSTGFGKGGATVEDVKLMADTVKGSGLKVKASGGIHTYEEAVAMVNAGADRLGTSSGLEIVK